MQTPDPILVSIYCSCYSDLSYPLAGADGVLHGVHHGQQGMF